MARFSILTQYFPPEKGAPQVRLAAMAQELSRAGHRVAVVTAMPNYPDGKVQAGYQGRTWCRESLGGVTVIRTWIYPATGLRVTRRMASYMSFTLSSLGGLILAGRPDYIFVESPPLFLGITGWLYGKLAGARVLFNVSDLWPASAEALGVITNRWLLRFADRLAIFLYQSSYQVSAVTDGIAADIRLLADGRTTVATLPNGVDTDLFRPLQEADLPGSVLAPHKVVFTYAGTHGYAQGLGTLLDAAARLRDTHPEVLIRFVGDGPVKLELEKEAFRRDLTNVEFISAQPVEAMAAWFSASRASLVPLKDLALFESARPSKILPSLACAVPVIYGGRGETATLLEQADCGIAVRPENVDDLVEAIRRLVVDREDAAAMGARGRTLALERYRWESIVRDWLRQLPDPPAPG